GDVVDHASRLLEDWRTTMARRSDSDVDPLVTVIREGGPFHCLGELPGYLERLRRTGRAAAASELEQRHPAPPPRRQSLN
ncbi:sulfatase, partial [Mesorhizobium sp. M4B.F.Ca.ET.211.01.1.1]